MVNLEWYRSFVAIYRAGTVSGAAKACSLTQPAVSQHLAALEQLVGMPLFTRTPRQMIPTEWGKALYSQIAQSFDKLEQVSQQFSGSDAAEKPLLRFGAPLEYFYEIMLERLDALPWRLWFEFGTAPQLAQRLARKELDVIVTPQRIPLSAVGYEPLTEERFWLVGAAEQAMPPTSKDDLEALEQWLIAQRWVSYGIDLPIIRRFWHRAFQHRPDFQPDLVIPNLHALVKAVELGYGLSILPDYLCHKGIAAGRLQQLWQPDRVIANELWLGFHKTARPSGVIGAFQGRFALSLNEPLLFGPRRGHRP